MTDDTHRYKFKKVYTEKSEIKLIDFLCYRFPYLSRKDWEYRILNSEIRLNGSTGKFCERKLSIGDVLEFVPDKFQEPNVDSTYSILYEDKDIIAINKSGNLPVHPSGIYITNNLLTLLESDLGKKLFTIHRLDRETSGVILFAKNNATASEMGTLWMKKKVRKYYFVIVHSLGKNFPEKLRIKGVISTDPKSAVRKKKKVEFQSGDILRSQSQFVDTKFKVVKRLSEYILLLAIPVTGRTHQIRASLCSYGFPVVQDKIYGTDENEFLRFINQNPKEKLQNEKKPFSRQMLHSYAIQFIHPKTGIKTMIKSPVPEDMRSFELF